MPVTRTSATMITRDGVQLDADVWRPDDAGPLPVLLMRQPYGRSIASTVTYAHPSWYAAHGYMVVIQDVRGRGTSGGDFRLCVHEQADGGETVAWAAGMPGSSGTVGMYGFSYQGMTQLFAAAARPPALRAIAPAMAAWDVRRDFATEGDAFRLQAGMGWGCQLALETVRRTGDAAAHQAIYAASRSLPLHSEVPCRPQIATLLGQHGHYLDWLTQPPDARYWQDVSPAAVASAIDVPALHIGGWYDPLLGGTLAGYHALASARRAPQRLVVGPWVHIPWSRQVGDRDFGPAASSDIDAAQIRWFDRWLKDRTGDDAAVSLFEMGATWRNFDAWPQGEPQTWRLASTGRAGMHPEDGVLAVPGGSEAGSDRTGSDGAGQDVIVYDPWRPTPSLGGHAGHPAGPIDRAAVDARSDVLTYTSAPLTADLRLAGYVGATIAATADAPSFDLHVVLSEVAASGGVFELASGYRRCASAGVLAIDMRAVCARVPAGSRLRLSVAAGAFPAFAVNSGTGKPAAEERLIEQRIVTITLNLGTSALRLPVA